MRPTMKAIAREAGCSVMTVSLALRDHPRISEATRERIQKVATQLGYRPNPMVSTLMTHIRSSRPANYQSNLAFFAYRSVWKLHWVNRDLFDGIRARAEDLGFFVDIFWIEDYEEHPGSLEKVLRSRNIQGVIISPLPEAGNLDRFNWKDWSAVAVGNSLLSPRIHVATHHQYHGMSLILKTLQAKGYRRIGLAMGTFVDDKVDRTWTSCLAGFQLRLPVKERVPILLDDSDDTLLARWLNKHQPDVLIGHDALVDRLRRAGVRIPQDVAFAHLSLPTQLSPRKFSGLNQNWHLAGAAAVDSVVAQIHRNERGLPENPKAVMVEGFWVEGDTTPGKTHPVK